MKFEIFTLKELKARYDAFVQEAVELEEELRFLGYEIEAMDDEIRYRESIL